MEWLGAGGASMFILILTQSIVYYRAVFSGKRRVILYIVERNWFVLSAEVLHLCGGDDPYN